MTYEAELAALKHTANLERESGARGMDVYSDSLRNLKSLEQWCLDQGWEVIHRGWWVDHFRANWRY